MTFHKINIPKGQSALAGLVLYQSWTATIQKNSDFMSQFFILKKFDLFYIN